MEKRPLFWAAAAAAAGMLTASFFLKGDYSAFSFSAVVLGLSSFFAGKLLSRRAALATLSIFLVGAGEYLAVDLTNRSQIPVQVGQVFIKGRISSSVTVDGQTARFRLRLSEVGQQAVDEEVEGRITLQTKSEQEEVSGWKTGTVLHFPAAFEEPDPPRNPGAFDYKTWLYDQRVHWIVSSHSLSQVTSTSPGSYRYDTLLDTFRTWCAQSADRIFPSQSSMMKALLLGLRSDIPDDILNTYSALGLIHVIAISGLHMTVITGGFLYLLRLAGATRELSIFVTILMIIFYVILTGAPPSVVRSGIMTLAVLLGLYLRKPIDGLNILGAALLPMILLNPYVIWNIGFQLSFLVTGALILFVPLFREQFSFLPTVISSLTAVTLTAQLASFPVIINSFHQYSFLSAPVNLLVVPVFSLVIIPLGFCSFLLGLIHPGLAFLPASLTELCLQGVQVLLETVKESGPRYLFMNFSGLQAWWMVLYYIALLCGLWIMKERRIDWIFFIFVFCLAPVPEVPPEDKVTVTFLDVGQGDAVTVEMPDHRMYLIDGGGRSLIQDGEEGWRTGRKPFDAGKAVVVPFLRYEGMNRLDTVIMTHGDQDHIGGLSSVLAAIPAERVLGNGKPPGSREEEKLIDWIGEHHIPLYRTTEGVSWEVSRQVKWTVLGPPADTKSLSDNNSSVVLLLEAYGYKFVFTGDLEAAGEKELLNKYSIGSVDVLKAGHHGSRSSTSRAWAEKLKPGVTVISAGRNNRFGHPHPETLRTLQTVNSRIYRTDQQGAVIIEISKDSMKIRTMLKQKE